MIVNGYERFYIRYSFFFKNPTLFIILWIAIFSRNVSFYLKGIETSFLSPWKNRIIARVSRIVSK